MSDRNAWVGPFVGRLTRLANPDNPDRAALAHLRRGLGDPAGTLARVGWLFNGVPDDRADNALNSAVLAAGLFAWTKGRCENASNVNFGKASGAGLSEDDKKQREKRFTALLDADPTELPFLLRQAVTLIEGTSLDWAALITHLMSWDHPDRWVQKDWARGFWWTSTTAEQPAESTAATE